MNDGRDVFLSTCRSYEKRDLKLRFDRFAGAGAFASEFSGKAVLLKPNLISSRGSQLGCTNGIFLAALAEWFVDCGARVSVGDSPAFGTARQVLTRQDIIRRLDHLPVTIVEFKTPREHDMSHGVRVGIAAEALDCDLFVNIPRIKAHSQMFMTIGVKNLFGIVVGIRKALAHMKNGNSHLKFADLMLDLISILPPHITVCDGIEAMHRQGPVNGEPIALGCTSCSQDPVALDTALFCALELDHRSSPIWRAANRRDMAGSNPENLSYPLQSPEVFHGSGFIPPPDLQPVVFNPFRFLTSAVRRGVSALRA